MSCVYQSLLPYSVNLAVVHVPGIPKMMCCDNCLLKKLELFHSFLVVVVGIQFTRLFSRVVMNKSLKSCVYNLFPLIFSVEKKTLSHVDLFSNVMYLQNVDNHISLQIPFSLLSVNCHALRGNIVEWFPVVFSIV